MEEKLKQIAELFMDIAIDYDLQYITACLFNDCQEISVDISTQKTGNYPIKEGCEIRKMKHKIN